MKKLLFIFLVLFVANQAFGQATPSCFPTSASWYSETGSIMYNSDTLKITGFSGSNINDVGLTSACNPTTGYLSRLAWVPINFQQGGVYAARTGIMPAYLDYGNQEQIWIDFNDDGIFQVSEEVTPVSGYSFAVTPNPILFNITIPAGAATGIHLMRFRCIWDCHWACIGDALASHLSPCLSTYLGTAPEYWSGVVVDYLANIMTPCPFTVTATNSGPACPGGIDTLHGTIVSGTVTSYSWTGPAGYTSTLLNPVINPVTTAGTYTFMATNGTCTTYVTTTLVLTTPPALPVITPSSATICNGGSVELTTVPPLASDTIIWQNFNTGLTGSIGGTWTITNTSGSPLSYWQLRTPPGYAGAVPGDGSQYIEASPDAYSSGFTTTYFTSASVSTIGYTSASLSFNYYFFESDFWDVTTQIDYSTDGGATWNILYNYYTTGTTGSTTWTVGTPQQTIVMPPATIGIPNLKIRWHYNSDWGFYWAVDNILLYGTAISLAMPTWSPPTYLFTSSTFGTSYTTGLHTDSVFVHPTTVTVPTTITYYATVTNGTCSSTDSSVITINPTVTAISGLATICAGSSTPLTDGTAGGTWTSSNTLVATIGSTTGIVTGVAAGTTTIHYSIGGCSASFILTVITAPAPITGTLTVCTGNWVALADITLGGTWSSSASTIASVGTTGIVSGLSPGIAVITYSLGTCYTTAIVTVNISPSAISGSVPVCTGYTISLTDGTPGGSWTSANSLIASVGLGTGVVTGVASGVTNITYTAPGGCYATTLITVNATPPAITGASTVCIGSTTTLADITGGGTWTSTVITVATIGSTTGIVTGVAFGTTTISYTMATGCYKIFTETVDSLPTPIAGTTHVCVSSTTLLSDAGSGTWSSSNSAIATVGSGTGLVSGVAAGVATITYTLGTGCFVTALLTVNPLPANIVGNVPVCVNSTFTATDITPGGTWSVSGTQATVGATTGLVTGVLMGNPFISYTLTATGCYQTAILTVNPLPFTIAGVTIICDSSTTYLNDALSGGTWFSTNTNICTIGALTGNAYGIAVGIDTIVYTITATGCKTQTQLIVQPPPAPISGVLTVCPGLTTTLTDLISSGKWTTSTTSIATIDSVTGVITGLAPGTAIITYALGICSTSILVTVNPLPAIISGASQVCTNGAVTDLSDGVAGGHWYSSNPGIATVDSILGNVTGLSVGTTIITYKLTATGCYRTELLTVNPLPVPITGYDSICVGYFTTLADGTPGGTFSSGDPLVGIVNASTGKVTGISAGVVSIYYTVTATGCKVSVPVTVNPILTISTLIHATRGDTICALSSDTYIANSVNAGSAPVYQWKVNGINVGGPGNTYTYAPINGDLVKCILTSNATCAIPNTTTSNVLRMTVNPLVNPTVKMLAPSSEIMCVGTPQTFVVTTTQGGNTPTLLWTVNWLPVGTSDSSYTYTPNNGDIIRCGLVSSSPCPIPDTAFAIDTMTVLNYDTPRVAIVNPGSTSCQGNLITLVANTSNGGTAPSYSWTLNGAPTGGSGGTYTYSPTNNDIVTCQLTSSYLCPVPSNIATDTFNVHVDPVIIVTITGNPGVLVTIGTNDTLYANTINAGDDPSYQWYVNGILVPAATYYKYITNSLHNQDSVSCRVTTGSGTACEGVIGFNWMIVAVAPAGINDLSNSITDIKLVPNPNIGIFTVEGNITGAENEVVYEITDVIGQVVYKEKAKVENGVIKHNISLDNTIANGVYVLHLITDGASSVSRFTLNR